MLRSNAYQEGGFYQLYPVFRQSVVPGQSVVLELQTAFETAPFTQNLLSGGMAQMYAFYVPYRLLWPSWVDFIARAEGAPANVPTVNNAVSPFPAVFERGAVTTNVFGRRAYKLIYNQYFGSQTNGAPGLSYYDLPLDDADVSIKQVRTTDQWQGRFLANADLEDPTYLAPVTGANATISLNDFRQQMKLAFSSRRADMTGQKYVDAMLRMGVDLKWTMQMAPEFLGQSHIDFEAKESRASYSSAVAPAAQVGQAYARYSERMTLKTPRKFFAEHGIVMAMICIRPHFWNTGFKAPHEALISKVDDFFLGDNNSGIDKWDLGAWTPAVAATVASKRFAYLGSGQNIEGNAVAGSWRPTAAQNNTGNVTYPSLTIPQSTGALSGGSNWASFTRAKSYGPTPVKPAF